MDSVCMNSPIPNPCQPLHTSPSKSHKRYRPGICQNNWRAFFSAGSPYLQSLPPRGKRQWVPPKPSLPHRSEEHTSELQSRQYLVCRLLLEKKKITNAMTTFITTTTNTDPGMPLSNSAKIASTALTGHPRAAPEPAHRSSARARRQAQSSTD